MMTEETEEKGKLKCEKHKCVKCGSSFGYVRFKDKSWICRSCGHQDKEVII
jgi:ribosomal protein L37AE/L43A